MNVWDVLEELQRRGVELARLMYATADPTDVARRFAMTEQRAKQYRTVGAGLFGPLKDAAEKKIRAQAVAEAEEAALSIDALGVISRAVKSVRRGASCTRESMRLHLVRKAREVSVDELKAYADDAVLEANRQAPGATEHARQRRFARISRRADRDGMKTLTMRGPAREMTDFMKSVDATVRREWKKGDERRHEQARYDVIIKQRGTEALPAPVTAIVVPLEETDMVLRGTLPADADVVIGRTDGTTMTGREYVEEVFGGELLAALYDVEGRPLNLYRLQRFASDAQRMMQNVDSLVCSHDGCARAADTCEMHHIRPWASGGHTNLDNLTPLCPEHNAQNDDRRSGLPNGYMVRGPDGRVGRRLPDGTTRYNISPITKYSGRSTALRTIERRRGAGDET